MEATEQVVVLDENFEIEAVAEVKPSTSGNTSDFDDRDEDDSSIDIPNQGIPVSLTFLFIS